MHCAGWPGSSLPGEWGCCCHLPSDKSRKDWNKGPAWAGYLRHEGTIWGAWRCAGRAARAGGLAAGGGRWRCERLGWGDVRGGGRLTWFGWWG